MSNDLEFSLSEALLDPDVCRTKDVSYPMLVDYEPHETVREPMILFRPPAKRKEQSTAEKKARRKSGIEQTGKQKKNGIIFEFFNKKSKTDNTKHGTLYRSRSFDTLHRRLKGWSDVIQQDDQTVAAAVEKPNRQIYVYQHTTRKTREKNTEINNQEQNEENNETTDQMVEDTTTTTTSTTSSSDNHEEPCDDQTSMPPLVPKRDSQLFNEDGPAIYEVPLSVFSNKENNSSQNPTQIIHDPDHDGKDATQHTRENKSQPKSVEETVSSKNPGTAKPMRSSLVTKGSTSPLAPQKPARKRTSNSHQRRNSFTELDLMIPTKSANSQTTTPQALGDDVGLLRVKLLGVRISQQQTPACIGDYNSDEEDVSAVTPTDGLFCTLSLNGKQSRFESSLQPLKPIEQTAVWDHTENEAIFYCTGQQQMFVTSRKLPLKDHDSIQSGTLSQNPKSECFGVGIYPLTDQTPQKISQEDDNVNDWTAVTGVTQETTVNLEPNGTVLLEMSYIMLSPNSKVTCNGSVTVKFLNGMDCFRNGEPCWTCCTVDIDDENFGTTSSVLGMDDFLNKGYMDDIIEFTAFNNTVCRIQVWGFGTDETEYWFGEAYIPLATILSYSKHIVHQETEDNPLKLLSECEKEIIMPLEPVGTIGLVFNMSPAPEVEESSIQRGTIQMLEASGIFTPKAIAHFKQQSTFPEDVEADIVINGDDGLGVISSIPEENSLESYNTNEQSLSIVPKKRFIPSRISIKKNPRDIYTSGEFDHLEPSPTSLSYTNPILYSLTNSLRDKKQSLRLLQGTSIKLQVPTSYQEKVFRQLPDNFDPYREIEILKVEMRDIKAQLAETQFHREKAELKVKTLENQIQIWKDKYKGKKGKKYH